MTHLTLGPVQFLLQPAYEFIFTALHEGRFIGRQFPVNLF